MKTILSLLLLVFSMYLLLSVVLYLAQNRMVFLANMPGRGLVATPQDAGFTFEEIGLTNANGTWLHGWFVPAPESRGTVLFLHGNAGNISHRLDSIAIFRELGLSTLIFDYSGYGQSGGKPSEKNTYTDAQAAWDYLVNERGVKPQNIVIFGRSLGGAVASQLTINTRPGAVIIESCFTSAPDMAQRLYPFLPTRLLTRLEYPVIENVSNLSSPLLVVHSRQDEIIPFDMGETLYAATPEPKEFLELSGDHNGGFLMNRERYQDGLKSFLDKHLVE